MTDLNRREFVKLSAMSSFGLLIGMPLKLSAKSPDQKHVLQPLIHIDDQGQVTLFAQNPELGQGVKTSMPMIIAEELDVDWSTVKVKQSPLDSRLEDQFSGGSLSIRINFTAMRQAGASARQMLLQAAANQWQLPVSDLSTENGQVKHSASGRFLNYGELAEAAANLAVPDDPPLRPVQAFKLIGRSVSDVDLKKILTGTQTYSIDFTVPNMLYAVVRRSPYSDGQPLSFDGAKAKEIDGVVGFEMLRNDHHGGRIALPNSPNFVSGVAVLAENTWAAIKAAGLLKVEWEKPDPLPDSDQLMSEFEKSIEHEGESIRSDGNISEVSRVAVASIDSSFRLPFLAHVTMEPMNCTVDASGDQITVWAPTQNPGFLAETLAAVLKVEQSSIVVNVLRSGGAFGRRFYADFAVDAALLSRKSGRPVKVVWTREDDVRHDYFRSASLQRVQATVDDKGRISSFHHKVTSHSRGPYLERDGSPSELDNYEFPAGFIPNLKYEYVHTPARIPLGQWRAVAHSSNVFVVSSVIDELAVVSKTDPVKFWLRLVGIDQFVQVREDFRFDASRLAQVIKKVAELSDWGSQLNEGQGRGIAASYNQGAWVAEVAEVTVRDDVLKIDRIVAVIDCGLIINPRAAENQVQGGIIEGISSAMMGQITVKDGIVEQSNFHDYPISRMRQIPNIEVHFIKSEEPPRGLGEPPLPPVAPAICNAIFNATGKRIRELPLSKYLSV
jgi:isoquinoline 1-oxidoreductase beta subunit